MFGVGIGLASLSFLCSAAELVTDSGASRAETGECTSSAAGMDSRQTLSTEEMRERLVTLQLLGVDLNVRTLAVYRDFGLVGNSHADTCGSEHNT